MLSIRQGPFRSNDFDWSIGPGVAWNFRTGQGQHRNIDGPSRTRIIDIERAAGSAICTGKIKRDISAFNGRRHLEAIFFGKVIRIKIILKRIGAVRKFLDFSPHVLFTIRDEFFHGFQNQVFTVFF